MSNLCWLTEDQMARIPSLYPNKSETTLKLSYKNRGGLCLHFSYCTPNSNTASIITRQSELWIAVAFIGPASSQIPYEIEAKSRDTIQNTACGYIAIEGTKFRQKSPIPQSLVYEGTVTIIERAVGFCFFRPFSNDGSSRGWAATFTMRNCVIVKS